MHSITIVLARPETVDVGVPDLIGPFFEADMVGFFGRFRSIEQT